ncbi:hypothetical protein O9992_25460 [Vibrio lentus]|nr:hypothetical protein [Vibrio lentus]
MLAFHEVIVNERLIAGTTVSVRFNDVANWARQWLDPALPFFWFRLLLPCGVNLGLSQLFDSDSTGTAMMTTAIIQIHRYSGS